MGSSLDLFAPATRDWFRASFDGPTQVQERGFGVHRYWAEVCAKQPGFEFHHGYGLGVVAHGRDAPEIIRDLTSPSRPKTERQDIRNAYARLGLVLSLQGRVAELQLKRKPMRYAAHKLRKMAGRVGLVDP